MRLCKVEDLIGTEILAKDAMTLEYKIFAFCRHAS